VFLRDEEPVRLEQMGHGVQRFAGLLAELCLSDAPWVLMEEPEWRLSPEYQQRLGVAIHRVIERRVGPRQVFATTHSPVMAAQGQAFCVAPGASGPVVEQKEWEAAGVDRRVDPQVEASANLNRLIGLVDDLSGLDLENAELPPEAVAAA
jgi:predicted ATPase